MCNHAVRGRFRKIQESIGYRRQQGVSQFLEKGRLEPVVRWLAPATVPTECTQPRDGPDATILERILSSGIDGPAIVATLRAAGNKMQILIHGAPAEVGDRIRGLVSGGEDYPVKPFGFGELLVRLDILIRRALDTPGTETTLKSAT